MCQELDRDHEGAEEEGRGYNLDDLASKKGYSSWLAREMVPV